MAVFRITARYYHIFQSTEDIALTIWIWSNTKTIHYNRVFQSTEDIALTIYIWSNIKIKINIMIIFDFIHVSNQISNNLIHFPENHATLHSRLHDFCEFEKELSILNKKSNISFKN